MDNIVSLLSLDRTFSRPITTAVSSTISLAFPFGKTLYVLMEA